MHAIHEPDDFAELHSEGADMSPLKRRALVIAALAAALLGLTLLDVAPSRVAAAKQHDAGSIDCIVASAVFAGVSVR